MDLDRTFKIFADRFAPDYVRWLLGPDIALDEVLKTELPASTRHADMVYRLTDTRRQAAFIWHVEFQAQRSEEPMPLRMLEYYTRLRARHHLPICSMVLYPTRTVWADDEGVLTESCLSDEVLRFRYRVVRLWEIETASLVQGGLWGPLPAFGTDEIGRAGRGKPAPMRGVGRSGVRPALAPGFVVRIQDVGRPGAAQRLVGCVDPKGDDHGIPGITRDLPGWCD